MKPDDSPDCPRCGVPMRLARVVPRAFGRPELRSFHCRACREAVTIEVPDAFSSASDTTMLEAAGRFARG